jgi:hypothetical protein
MVGVLIWVLDYNGGELSVCVGTGSIFANALATFWVFFVTLCIGLDLDLNSLRV